MTTLAKKMNLEEARHQLTRIRKAASQEARALDFVRGLLAEFHARRGWEVFTDEDGTPLYTDIWECCKRELADDWPYTRQRFKQITDAGQLDWRLSTSVDGYEPLPEGALRPLTPLKDSPEDLARAYETARRNAISRGSNRVTEADTRLAARPFKAKTREKKNDTTRVLALIDRLEHLADDIDKVPGVDRRAVTLIRDAVGVLESWLEK